ncbi:unnamed protein product [Closterium sp. NIES-65]|nr:unnamed protein product [Closterium sp. NIES-65]
MADSDCRTRLFSSPEGCSLALSDSARSGSGSGSGSSCRASDSSNNIAGNSVSAGSRINAGSSSSGGRNAAAHLKAVLATVLGEFRDVDTTEAVSQIAELCQLLSVTDPHCLPSAVTHLSTRAWHCEQLLRRMQQTQASLQTRQEQVTALAECIESWKAQLPSDDDISRATDDVADKIRRTAQEQQQLSLQRSAAQGSLEAAGYSADVDMAALLQLAAEVQGEEEEVGRLQHDLAIYSDLPTVRCGHQSRADTLAEGEGAPEVFLSEAGGHHSGSHAPAEGEGAPEVFLSEAGCVEHGGGGGGGGGRVIPQCDSSPPLCLPPSGHHSGSHAPAEGEGAPEVFLSEAGCVEHGGGGGGGGGRVIPQCDSSPPLCLPPSGHHSGSHAPAEGEGAPEDITLARTHLQRERERLRALSRKLEAWSMGEEVEDGEDREGYGHQSPGEGGGMGTWGVGGQGEGRRGVERSPGDSMMMQGGEREGGDVEDGGAIGGWGGGSCDTGDRPTCTGRPDGEGRGGKGDELDAVECGEWLQWGELGLTASRWDVGEVQLREGWAREDWDTREGEWEEKQEEGEEKQEEGEEVEEAGEEEVEEWGNDELKEESKEETELAVGMGDSEGEGEKGE